MRLRLQISDMRLHSFLNRALFVELSGLPFDKQQEFNSEMQRRVVNKHRNEQNAERFKAKL